jgi:hypothetical protein
MGGRSVFRSPANECCFSLKNSREKQVQKKSLDAIPTGYMFTPCHNLHGGTVVLFMVPAAGAPGKQREGKDYTAMCRAIWTNAETMEALHAIHRAINEWERVGAAEDVDLDEMAEVEGQLSAAMGEYELALQVFHERERKAD